MRILELFGLGCTLEAACNFNPDDSARQLLQFTSCGGCMNPSPATTKLPPPSTQAAWITPRASGAWIRTQATTIPARRFLVGAGMRDAQCQAYNYDDNANVSNGTCEFPAVPDACRKVRATTTRGHSCRVRDFPLFTSIAQKLFARRLQHLGDLGLHRRMCMQLRPHGQHRRRLLRARVVHGMCVPRSSQLRRLGHP